MDDSFELLEQKVRKAAELVRSLRAKNQALEQDVVDAKQGLKEAEKRLAALEKQRQSASAQSKQHAALEKEVGILREEREEIRTRIAKLVEVLDGLE
jgi:predicted  nucleic acid-binding Zn-ribbon protein